LTRIVGVIAWLQQLPERSWILGYIRQWVGGKCGAVP
jgi:hypothetical protein